MHLRQKVNMRQLRCFHAVAQEGSFTSAARALFVGQPSITTHVRGLERHFGVESLEQLSAVEFLNPEEMEILIRGRDFMWRVR